MRLGWYAWQQHRSRTLCRLSRTIGDWGVGMSAQAESTQRDAQEIAGIGRVVEIKLRSSTEFQIYQQLWASGCQMLSPNKHAQTGLIKLHTTTCPAVMTDCARLSTMQLITACDRVQPKPSCSKS